MAGQSLLIPSQALNANSSETLKPYEPGKATGSLDPTLPMPANKDKCGGMGKIIMAVVAVAVAAWAPQFLTQLGATGMFSANGTISALGGAIGGAAGSIASQAVGVAIGAQDKFSWKGVALSALAGGITGGLNANTQLFNLTSSPAVNTALRMATANALTQGIGVATGLQKKFDWKGVAASAAGGFAGAAVGARLPDGLDPFLGKIVTGFAAGTAAAVAQGGRVAIQQVAVDAFGNALGSSLAAASSSGSSYGQAARSSDPLGAFIEQNQGAWNQRQVRYDQMVDAFGNPTAYGRDDDVLLAAGPGYSGMGSDRLRLGTDDLDSQIAGAKAFLGGMNKQGMGAASSAAASGKAAWLASEAQATSNLYASGAGDIRETVASIATNGDRWIPNGNSDLDGGSVVGSKMTQAEMDEFDRLNPGVNELGSGSINGISEVESFFTFNPAGRAIQGAGSALYDTWTALPRAIGGVGTLASDAMGYASNAIAPQRSVLTGEAFAYQPKSALLQSIQQQGVLGMLGTGITGAVRSAPGIGLIGALGSPSRDWGNVGAQVFNTGTAMAGAAASMRGSSVIDFSTGEKFAPGYYRADPGQLRFSQSDASPNFVDRGTGKHIGTIDSLVSDLQAGRVTADQVGSPLQVVMHEGKPFSIDNRRLVGFNAAGVSDVPIQIVSLRDPGVAARFFDRFDPIRGEGLNIVITPASGRTAAQILMRDQGLINGVQLRN